MIGSLLPVAHCSRSLCVMESAIVAADVRPLAAQGADLGRRTAGSVRNLRVVVLAPDVPGHLYAEHPRLLGRRRRPAVPATDRRDLPHRRYRRQVEWSRPAPVAHWRRLCPDRHRARRDARSHDHDELDAPDSGRCLPGSAPSLSTSAASTAVGVVHPARAGMASGINNTLRQSASLPASPCSARSSRRRSG